MRTLLLMSAAMLLIACSNDDDTTPDLGTDGPLATDAGLDTSVDTTSSDASASEASADSFHSSGVGTATDVELGLHDNKVKIVLATMAVVGTEATEWDLWMNHNDPVDHLPHLELGAGVTAQNLGNSDTFHEVDTAPTTGYEADDPDAEIYVIGSSWRNGGSGGSGFIMTKNIYALKLADGTYAKIEVLSAKSGEVHILAYRQSTPGDTNLATAP